ncbi:hypothetical protein, partial [Rhodococcus pyridinivorans]
SMGRVFPIPSCRWSVWRGFVGQASSLTDTCARLTPNSIVPPAPLQRIAERLVREGDIDRPGLPPRQRHLLTGDDCLEIILARTDRVLDRVVQLLFDV